MKERPYLEDLVVNGANYLNVSYINGIGVRGEWINPLTSNDLKKRRAVRHLKIKIPVKNLGRQRCAEGCNSGVKVVMCLRI
jgi:hypothetical protein